MNLHSSSSTVILYSIQYEGYQLLNNGQQTLCLILVTSVIHQLVSAQLKANYQHLWIKETLPIYKLQSETSHSDESDTVENSSTILHHSH